MLIEVCKFLMIFVSNILSKFVGTNGSRKIAPEENCPPAVILMLIVNQTLTLTGGNSPDTGTNNRSSQPEVFCEKGVLKNFAKFTEKHLCLSLFFNKVTGLWLLLKQCIFDVFIDEKRAQ